MSVGQGDVQTTPLQVATAFAAIANGGTRYVPHVAHEIVHGDGTVDQVQPEVAGQLPTSASALALIEQGLIGVTAAGGTAGSVFGSFPIAIAGKTGTAELKPRQPYAWFAAYGPVDDPEYVVVAVVEEGGGGSQTAAPIARSIFESLYELGDGEVVVGEATD